jgi:hypothetical protein
VDAFALATIGQPYYGTISEIDELITDETRSAALRGLQH